MINFRNYMLLMEGGAGGHMIHPVDLPGINNGRQLQALFDKVVIHLKQQSAGAKIDGTNNSLRLVEGPNGKEFAVDRGSMKDLDLEGITLDKLELKWPNEIIIEPGQEVVEKQHGMVKSNQILLSIMNEALPFIEPELKALKLWDNKDPKTARYINTEFVDASEGGPNVVKYGKNFIAFHGINKYRHVNEINPASGRKQNRREGKKIKNKLGQPTYNVNAFNRMVNKVHAVSKKQGYDTHGVVPVRFKGEPDFMGELESKVTIVHAHNDEDTRSLDLWLSQASNPTGQKVKLLDGKRENVMQLKFYEMIIGEDNRSTTPLQEIFEEDNVNMKMAIDAAIMWHTTRVLGRQILNNLETDHGDVIPVGEGTVIEGLLPSPRAAAAYPDFKISGDFIIQNRYAGIGV